MRYATLCSGVDMVAVALDPLGWEQVFCAEIEKFPSAVMAHHKPHVPNLGDVTAIDGAAWRGQVDFLWASTPCQAFSVAGRRGGTADARGALTIKVVDLIDEIDPPIFAWENVKGVLSDKSNAFGCFLAALAGEDEPLVAPGGRWTHAGYVLGPKRAIAWRLVDAQYRGLAQRRQRVLLVACPRDGADPREVLFEREGLRRDSPPSREAREDAAARAAPRAFGGNNTGGDIDVATARSASSSPHGRLDFETETFLVDVAPALRAGNHWNNSDPGLEAQSLVPVAFAHQGGGVQTTLGFDPASETCMTLQAHQTPAIAFALRGREDGAVPEIHGEGDTASALRAANGGSSRDYIASPIFAIQERAVCENPLAGPDGKGFRDDGAAYTLEARSVPQAVAFTCSEMSNSFAWERDVAPTIQAHPQSETSNIQTGVRVGTAVRRLTPTECERLMGLPDNYTLIPWGKKPAAECPDGPRYKAIGNGVAVPDVNWLGRRVELVLAWIDMELSERLAA